MPETVEARTKIMEYKEKNNISYEQLSLMTGYSKSNIYDAVTGRRKNASANQILLKIIQMFDIK